MLSEEEKEIFKNLKEYMQNNINNGYHKFVYNDLDWDFKCIDCINAIDKVLKQSKEIEEIKKYKKYYEEMEEVNKKFIAVDKIKAKIEELDYKDISNFERRCKQEALQSLLEKE